MRIIAESTVAKTQHTNETAMRGEAEQADKGRITEGFACLNNKACALDPREDMELLNGFKPQAEITSAAGV